MNKQNIAIIGGIVFVAVLGVVGFILMRPEPTPVPADFDNQADCEAANFYWWNDTCNLEAEVIPAPVPADFDNQADCEAVNFYWWNNTCNLGARPIEPEITLEVEEVFSEGEKITATVDITNPADRYFSGEIPVYFAGEKIYIQVVDLPPGETIEKQVTIVEKAQLGEFTLEIAGITTEIIVLDKPTIEGANVILEESIKKTLGLTSFTTTGDGVFQFKDGEVIIFEIGMKDLKASVINPFDFANQDSSMVITYNMMINFGAIANHMEATMTPEELEEMKEDFMGIDIITTFRTIDEANISVTMEIKSIDFDFYIKLVEIAGLREIIVSAMGPFVGPPIADKIMAEIEPYLGIWHKTPADPAMVEEMTVMFENMEGLILSFFDTFYVKEVLPSTRVEGVPVYNFALGMDLEKMKDVVISFIPLIAEKAEMEIDKKEEIKAEIIEFWPKIVEIIEAMEIDYRIYICQETHFTIKETGTANINLHELMTILEPIITAEMTPEELAEFEKTKTVIKNMSIVMTMNVIYGDHNVVPPIQSPEEYEIIEFPGPFLEPIPEDEVPQWDIYF